MNLNEIEAKCFIMALFIRDDGLRFLLGSGAYEFKDSQLMFAGNTIENDVVSVQGNDGYMLAGQVRRPNTQVFDGYIGDASVSKSEVEGYRRDFMAFFQKNHFYTVVYVMADGSAIQRRRGFLVDAPTSQELWQMYPEYHVALNFEDVNYYRYSENDDGEETYAKSADIGLAKVQYGGLIWDNNSEIEISGTGTNITLAGTMEGGAIESVELNGDTTQATYSGKNLYESIPRESQGLVGTLQADGTVAITGKATSNYSDICSNATTNLAAGTYTFSITKTMPFRVLLRVNDSQNLAVLEPGAVKGTFTVAYAITQLRVFFYNVTSGTTYNETVGFQLEAGNQATSFEPYVGGTASPNPDYPQEVQTVTGEQTVTVASKNILANIDNLNATDNGITNTLNADGSITCSGTVGNGWNGWGISGYTANELEAGTYTFSIDQAITSDITVSFRDSSNNTIGAAAITAGQTSATATISGQTARTSLWVAATTGTQIDFTISAMLEKGSLATSFVPYATLTYPINLGKNLLDEATMESGSFNYLNGGLFANATFIRSQQVPCEPNTTYAFSSNSVLGEFAVVYYASDKTTVVPGEGYLANYRSTTFTTPATARYMRVKVGGSANPRTLDGDWDLQLEKGSTATTYAPYIQAFGKNLFDKNNPNIFIGYFYDGSPVLSPQTGNANNYVFYIPCEPSTAYSFRLPTASANPPLGTKNIGTTSVLPAAGVSVSGVTEDISRDTATYENYVTASDAKYLVVRIQGTSFAQGGGGLELTLANLQIEKGSTATTYEPNMSGQIELCKIGTYQDYIYKSGNDWYVKKNIGKQNMSALSGLSVISTGNFIASSFASTYGSVIGEMRSNIFTYSDTGWEKVGKFGIAASGNMWAMTGDSTITTANISTWLSNKNAVVYYALATPTDTQITNATLISELEDLLSATTYSGTTYITVSGDLASPLEIKVITIGGGGVVWDENGAEWEAGGGGEIVIVNVDSIENILPVWTIRGEAENPTLTNLTTGMSITYNGTVASGQTLVIDLLNKTAKLNGTSVISDVSGQWVEFKPGNNRVSYSTENANAPDSTIEWQEVVG